MKPKLWISTIFARNQKSQALFSGFTFDFKWQHFNTDCCHHHHHFPSIHHQHHMHSSKKKQHFYKTNVICKTHFTSAKRVINTIYQPQETWNRKWTEREKREKEKYATKTRKNVIFLWAWHFIFIYRIYLRRKSNSAWRRNEWLILYRLLG